MRTRRRVASGLLAALLLLPVPFSALPMYAHGAPAPRAQVSARQAIPAAPRQIRRIQANQRRNLEQLFRSIRVLLRNEQRLARQLGVVSPFRLTITISLPL